MRRLRRHQYYVVLLGGKILLCDVKDDGPEWFAGDYFYQEVPYPMSPDLLADIAGVLELPEQDILMAIEQQRALKQKKLTSE